LYFALVSGASVLAPLGSMPKAEQDACAFLSRYPKIEGSIKNGKMQLKTLALLFRNFTRLF
jgi:hypothetical protein